MKMRVWTKCVMDLSGTVIEAESESFDYEGPLTEAKGGTSSTTNVIVAGPTAEETALAQKQVELAEFQLQELQKQSEAQAAFSAEISPLLAIQAQEAERAFQQNLKNEPIQDELLQLALEDLRRGGAATPEQIEQITAAADATLAAGEFDINRFRDESLEALREELAGSLGLRPGDTPILDRVNRPGIAGGSNS